MAAKRDKSRKPSASSVQRLEPPVIFLDECVDCDSIADALLQQGANVERHRDHFERGAEDSDWLVEVGRRGWVVLTADKRQRRSQLELAAIVEAEARVFVLRGSHVSGRERASRVALHHRRMCSVARSQPAPFVAHITKGRVQVMHQRRALRSQVRFKK